jgi:3-oxoadipate enol-lactonase
VPTAPLPGVQLFHEVVGEGPPLLAINGSGTDLRMPMSSLQWPVVERFTVAAYDHRGLGRSVPDDPDAQPAMDDFAHDAIALADHLGWDRFAVVGVSFGGMVAQHVAAVAGDRVTRLVLACTSSGGAGGSSYPLHEVAPLPPPERAERMVDLLDTRAAEDAELRAMFLPFLQLDETPPAPGYLKQLEARRHHDAWDRLPSITAPTLVAAGRHDGIAPLANSQALADRIPRAELATFDGGHAFVVQDPAAWPAILGFLA